MVEIDKSIVGQKFGYLTVLDIERRSKKLFCKCLCDCGKTVEIYKGNITNAHTISCGCRKNRKYAHEKMGLLVGKKFGNLVVLREYIKENNLPYCYCHCDCGKDKEVKRNLLLHHKIAHCDNCILQYDYLKNQKYGDLIIQRIIFQNKRICCECLCDCGKNSTLILSDVLKGSVTNCGCKLETKYYKDIPGKKFGNLTVSSVIAKNQYSCICSCGNCIEVTPHLLKNKSSILHCGCKFVGEKYGKLTIIKAYRKKNKFYCKCLCDCGNTFITTLTNLQYGHTRSCGCLIQNDEYKNIIGKKFGKLNVIEELAISDPNGHKHFLCLCDCGNKIEVLGNNLIHHQTESCGCKKIVRRLTSKIPINNTSGVKGVYFDKKSNRWVAFIGYNHQKYKVNCENFEDAVKNRRQLEAKYHLPVIEKYN